MAEQRWREIYNDVKWTTAFMPEATPAQARRVYEDFLYAYERTTNVPTKFRLKGKKHHVKLQDVDPRLLKEVPIYTL